MTNDDDGTCRDVDISGEEDNVRASQEGNSDVMCHGEVGNIEENRGARAEVDDEMNRSENEDGDEEEEIHDQSFSEQYEGSDVDLCAMDTRTGEQHNVLSDEEILDIMEDVNGTKDTSSRTKSGTAYVSGISPRNIMDMLRMPGRDKGLVAIRKLKGKNLDDLEANHAKQLARIMKNMILKTADAFIPGDGKKLVWNAVKLMDFPTWEKEMLSACLRKCRGRSLEKRLPRSIVYGSLGARQAKRMIAEDIEQSRIIGDEEEEDIEGVEEDDGNGREEEEDRDENDGGNEITKRKKKRRTRLRLKERLDNGNCWRMYERAKADWGHFNEHGFIKPLTRRLKRVSDDTLGEAVSFALQRNYRQLLAFGSKKVTLQGGEVVIFPKIRRTVSRLSIVRDYKDMKKDETTIPAVGDTSMMAMLRKITSGQQRMKGCVDYNLGILVFENIRNLEYIIRERIDDVKERETTLDQIAAAGDFLKHGLYAHIDKDSDVAHCSRRALVGTTESSGIGRSRNGMGIGGGTTECNECLKPFQTLEIIRKKVTKGDIAINNIIDDAAVKFKLFMGHQVRCQVQRSAIREAKLEVMRKPVEEVAILTIDYKMKFEPKKYRQKSSDWYGRKGISWHGSVLTYKKESNERNCENSGETVQITNLYFDHVCRNDSNQTAYAVGSIIELVCRQIRREVPALKRIILHSDNAGNYSNNIVPVMLPFIFQQYGLQLDKIVYSETQDGKGAADAHFACAMRHVDAFIEENGLDVVTPTELCYAINHGRGMRGCIGELFDVNNNCEQAIMWKAARKKGGGLSVLGRNNIVKYEHDRSGNGYFIVSTYAYKCSKAVKWKFEIGKSTLVEGNVEEEEPGDNEVGEGAHSEVNRNREGDDCDDDEESGDSSAVHDVNACSHGSVVGSRRLLDDGDELETLFEGNITGVKLIKSGYVKRTSTVVKKMEDESVEKDEESSDEYSSENDSDEERLCTEVAPMHNVFQRSGEQFLCGKCGQTHQSERAVRQHYVECKVPQRSMLFADRAVRLAKYLIDTDVVRIHREATQNPVLQAMEVTEEVRRKIIFGQYWARRPVRGDSLGKIFMEAYKEDIKKMVEAGITDKGKRLSSSQMLEQLKRMYPTRYDLPATLHIGNYVKTVLKNHREEKEIAEGRMAPKNARYAMPQEYVDIIERMVKDDDTIMPKAGAEKFFKKVTGPPRLVPDNVEMPKFESVKNKISSVKARVKKEKLQLGNGVNGTANISHSNEASVANIGLEVDRNGDKTTEK